MDKLKGCDILLGNGRGFNISQKVKLLSEKCTIGFLIGHPGL